MVQLTREFIKSLPKAELHCHLDGSMRVDTIVDLIMGFLGGVMGYIVGYAVSTLDLDEEMI